LPIPAQTVDGEFEFYLHDLTTTILSFWGNGDFYVKINVNNDQNQHVACLRFLFTINKA
jgi:hypothetical protein